MTAAFDELTVDLSSVPVPAQCPAPVEAVRALELPPTRRAGAAWAVLNAVVAVLIVLLVLPVLLAVAVAVKLDGGPVAG